MSKSCQHSGVVGLMDIPGLIPGRLGEVVLLRREGDIVSLVIACSSGTMD